MRILIVCDFLFKYGAQQARSLAHAGQDVSMLVRAHALEFGGSTDERRRVLDGLRVDGVRQYVIPGRIRSPSAAPTLVKVRRRLRMWQPHIVHVHENHDPRLLAVTHGFRTVFTVHDPVEHLGARAFTRLDAWVTNQWLRRAQRIVVHSDTLAAELAATAGPARIAVIPHGTWPRDQPLSVPTTPAVLLFGRLESYKGVDVLVPAMHVVWRERPDVRLIVAGEGPAAELVPEHPRVKLIARYIPEAEVQPLLSEATLVALPYTQASQSGVGALAIAAGVPVVVTDVGALPELAYEPGFVARAGDPSALAAAILRNLDHNADVRRAVIEHARTRFSWDHAAELSLELYRDVLRAS
jgi:glycosyltransferase involved in cell wall biosynthesis